MGEDVGLQTKSSSLEPLSNDHAASAPELVIALGRQQMDASSSQLQVCIFLSLRNCDLGIDQSNNRSKSMKGQRFCIVLRYLRQ